MSSTHCQTNDLKGKNGKFLSEVLPAEGAKEVKWKEYTIKSAAKRLHSFNQ